MDFSGIKAFDGNIAVDIPRYGGNSDELMHASPLEQLAAFSSTLNPEGVVVDQLYASVGCRSAESQNVICVVLQLAQGQAYKQHLAVAGRGLALKPLAPINGCSFGSLQGSFVI